MDFFEKELMNNIRIPQQETIRTITVKPEPEKEQKFEPKIKTSIVARPLFKSNFERYEWHLQNGCLNPDDRTWFENYIKSDEYQEIYK